MAEKDLTEKILMDYNDVFADIVNTLLFDGREAIKPSSLENKSVHAMYKADDEKLHEEERDVFKLWKECGVEIALCGLENQTDSFKFMPARIIGYEGANYRAQILHEELYVKHREKITPVITLVLYFGLGHWEQPKNLSELFGQYPDEFKKYVNDYRINVFEIAWLPDEVIEKFTSDFKVVARFFSDRRKYGEDYIPKDPTVITHVDEVLKLLSVMTHDHRYEEITFTAEERRHVDMDAMVSKLVNIGEAKGETKGRAEERADNIEKFALHLMQLNPGLSKDEAINQVKIILR